jgi:hypothetical protein
MSDPSARSLVVSRSELTVAAKRLTHLSPKGQLRSSELVLRCRDGHLILEIPGGAVEIPATGRWPGLVRVPGVVLLLFAKGEPPGDPVEIESEGTDFHVRAGGAHMKFKAQREDISPLHLEVTLDATDRDYLRLAVDHSPAQILSSGLENRVAAAEMRFQASVDHAYSTLMHFGVSRVDLESVLRALVTGRGG